MARVSQTPRRPRNSIKDRPPRFSLLLRRVRSRARGIALVTILVLGAAGLAALARSDAAPAGRALRARLGAAAALAGFRIEHVVIEGHYHTPRAKLLAALDVHQGDPTLGFSLAAARERLERLPWVKSATIERRLPGTLVVRVIEKRPFALWQHGTTFSVIDRAGEVVEARNVHNFRNLPLVVGPGAPASTAKLLDALTKLPNVAKHVVAAVRVGERRWNLLLKDGTTVELPEGHVKVALLRLAALERTHALLDRPLAVVDMRLPDRLVLRPRPGEKSPDGAAKEPG